MATRDRGEGPASEADDSLLRRIHRTLATDTRFEGFRGRLAHGLRASTGEVDALLRSIRSGKHWRPGRFSGTRSIRASVGGRVVMIVEALPGARVPLHRHAEPELAFCLQGSADQGNGSRLEVGDQAVTPAGQRHGYESVGAMPCILVLTRRLRSEVRRRDARAAKADGPRD